MTISIVRKRENGLKVEKSLKKLGKGKGKMGLAASQARLLLLTSRKNDVEGQMMSISNEKLSLSRQSAKLSQQYSDALNAQKLVWNTGTDSLDLSYGLLTTPTTLDGQYLLADPNGSIILDSTLASKLGLSDSGTASSFKSLYPSAGTFVAKCMGVTGADADTIITDANKMVQSGVSTDLSSSKFTTAYSDSDVFSYLSDTDNGYTVPYFITGNDDEQTTYYNNNGSPNVVQFFHCPDTGNGLSSEYKTAATAAVKSFVSNICSDSTDAILAVLDGKYNYSSSTWDKIEAAATKAKQDTVNFYGNNMQNGKYWVNSDSSDNSNNNTSKGIEGSNAIADDTRAGEELYIDVSQITKTFLAYFDAECDKINGGTGSNYTSEVGDYSIKYGTTHTQTGSSVSVVNGVYTTTPTYTDTTTATGSNSATQRKAVGGTGTVCGETVDSDIAVGDASEDLNKDGIGDTYELKFYINMYNALANRGWQLNENVTNSKYMQNQIMYGNISVLQLTSEGNWSALSSNDVNSPLETVADDSGTNQAEAKYEASKDELDYKESKLDLQMNDLDTERSAIETEVDSVQKLINKNIEGSFKLFQNA